MKLRFLATSVVLMMSISAVVYAKDGMPRSAGATASASFNPDSVPVSAKGLPAFPYLEWPNRLNPVHRKEQQKNFDRGYFVAGKLLRPVEGRLSDRKFSLRFAGLSRLEALRNYDQAIRSLGGVRIDAAQPEQKSFIAANGGDIVDIVKNRLAINDNLFDYAAYLIRTSQKRIWIAVAVSDSNVFLRTVEEQAMEQTVSLTKADEMKAALDKQGFVALYINFDTDKAALRDDGKPAVDEIAKLLKANPGMRLSIEGHTDNSGDAQRNKVLSEQRAATIVSALKAQGIEATRLKSAGFGADKPVADNRTEDGRASNRRVELVKM